MDLLYAAAQFCYQTNSCGSPAMKRILTYTIGWDTETKQGYLTVIDESQTTHALANLSLNEVKILVDLLKENSVLIDQNNWLISGWPGNYPTSDFNKK